MLHVTFHPIVHMVTVIATDVYIHTLDLSTIDVEIHPLFFRHFCGFLSLGMRVCFFFLGSVQLPPPNLQGVLQPHLAGDA